MATDESRTLDVSSQFWTEDERNVLIENFHYHELITKFIPALLKNGPEMMSIRPKAPKSLDSLIDKSKHSKDLTGIELHDYLVKNLCDTSSVSCKRVEDCNSFANLDSILPNLKSGYSILKKQNSVSLSTSIDYGNWLNIAFELHKVEKKSGKVKQFWKDWLYENIGITERYARQLREISQLFKYHSKFRNLGISFSEFYQRRKQINSMLLLHPQCSEYWKQTS